MDDLPTLHGNYKHGHCFTTEYRIWGNMKNRCLNPNNPAYKYYGKRGIKVCERWNSFENFYEDMGPRPKELTLDRINNDGNYEPSNCRWATRKEQCNNQTQPLGSSGHRGIYWVERDKVFHAKVKVGDIWKHIGCFRSLDTALAAQKKALV